MKKLLVLLMVVGIVGTASAVTVSLDPSGTQVVPAGTYELDIVGGDSDNYEWFLGVPDDTYGSIVDIAVTSKAGANAGKNAFGEFGDWADVWSINALSTDPDNPVQTGVQFTATVEYKGSAPGETFTVELLNNDIVATDQAVTYEVPEPMTIGLLGIGGLFLRRRFA